MFELYPVDSFPLCVESRFQADATSDLEYVSSEVRRATGAFPVAGLLLTGSVARGEGTLVADHETGTRWLGDLECLLLLTGRRLSTIDQIEHTLSELQHKLNCALRRRGLRTGITVMPVSGMRSLRPSIFNLELLEHGKLLWGTPEAIALPKWWLAGVRKVPLRDGFRLLNNRIIQQIAAREAQKEHSDPLAAAYAINKFWIELATSLSVCLGCYRTTYRDRQRAIEDLLTSSTHKFESKTLELFVTRLREAMAVKFGQTPDMAEPVEQRFREVADTASQVWYWESAHMLGTDPHASDWRLVLDRLRGLETIKQRTRDWVRLLVRDRSMRHFSAEAFGTLKTALRAGSLANAVYATGCLLEFFWDEIGLETRPWPEIARTLDGLFRVQTGNGIMRRSRWTRNAHAVWERHLRFAPI